MITAFSGPHLLVLVVYVLMLAVIAAALYVVVRLAVTHALKAHTLWMEGRSGPRP